MGRARGGGTRPRRTLATKDGSTGGGGLQDLGYSLSLIGPNINWHSATCTVTHNGSHLSCGVSQAELRRGQVSPVMPAMHQGLKICTQGAGELAQR